MEQKVEPYPFTVVKSLIMNSEGKLLALRRSKTDMRRAGEWDLPGGTVETGEDLRAAVIRETKEEANITLSNPRVVFACSEPRLPHGYGTWIIFAEKLADIPDVAVSWEHDAYKWLTLEEALAVFEYDLHKRAFQYVSDHKLLDRL
ncbi:MAG TPA: NUDIX hydrolase [Candidatus Saccharimonadales bacterium]|nr:NUDIX hydrolase [Candidatus Saccharimonadales bacterium]